MAASALTGQFSPGWAILGGLLGGMAFLIVVYIGLAIRMTRMDFLRILGTMMLPNARPATAVTAGFMARMMLSAGFGVVHAGLLHAIGVDSTQEATGWDGLIGLGHGLVILVLMPMMLALMHPLVRRGEVERPGPALVGFGSMTSLGSLSAHVAFGLVVGAVYAAALI